MDQGRFDSLARSLAAARTRRGLLGGLAALVVGARAASAQSSPCPIPGQTRNRKGDCSCPAGLGDVCPEVGCVDKKRDPNNCGRCGAQCLPGATCVKGECRCPAGGCFSDCATLPDGAQCGVGQICLGGACVGNGACPTDSVCPFTAGQCGDPACSPVAVTLCACTAEGGRACLAADFCNSLPNCETTGDCPAGYACFPGVCNPLTATCGRLCGAGGAPAARFATAGDGPIAGRP